MELDELLEREGFDGDDLLAWAEARAERLIAELIAGSDDLAKLLEPAAQIDLVPVRVPATSNAGAPKLEIVEDAEPTKPFDIPIDEAPHADAVEAGPRGRRRVPSNPQPLSAAELPPPPEHLPLAEGEPEPMLEHVDTGPIDLGTPEAQAMIAAHSTRIPLVEEELEPSAEAPADDAPPRQEITQVAPAPVAAASSAATEDSDEFDIDQSEDDESEEEEMELEEIDAEELEIVEMEESEDDEPEAPPPPPPPPRRPPPSSAAPPAPAKPAETVDIDGLLAELKGE